MAYFSWRFFFNAISFFSPQKQCKLLCFLNSRAQFTHTFLSHATVALNTQLPQRATVDRRPSAFRPPSAFHQWPILRFASNRRLSVTHSRVGASTLQISLCDKENLWINMPPNFQYISASCYQSLLGWTLMLDAAPDLLRLTLKRKEQSRMEDQEGGSSSSQKPPQNQNQNQRQKSSFVIEVPSYNDVLESTQSNSKPPSFFAPSETFTQAFASIKNSEFYAPPPPPISNPNSLSSDKPNASGSSSREFGGGSTPVPSSTMNASTVQRSNAILVSHRQKGNPLLKHIRNVRWNFTEIIPDYILGQNTCALYLSLRYHLLHPDYLFFRIRELQKNFRLRVVLCHVDVEDVVKPLLEVTRTSLLHDCTLLCAWSLEECGRYLETIKVYENKPADIIQGHMDSDYLSRLNHALTSIRHVNKTDVVTLGSTFGSLSHVMDASMDDLARCPGIGERKVKRLYDTFHEPFKRVMPSHPLAPETPAQSNLGPSSLASETPNTEKETEDTSERQKKEPELTIKSALSAAFAKYSGKLGKKDVQPEKESGQGSNTQKD